MHYFCTPKSNTFKKITENICEASFRELNWLKIKALVLGGWTSKYSNLLVVFTKGQ